MKPLALFTFACFLLALGSRFYAVRTSEKIQRKIAVQKSKPQPSLFSQPTTQLMADLQRLEEVIDEDTLQEEKQKEYQLALEKITELREEFELTFMSPTDNLIALKQMQDQIHRFADENDIPTLNSEVYDIFDLFYLMIFERMDFRAINEMRSLSELYTPSELKRIGDYTVTADFLTEIYQFKNIPLTEDNLESFQRSIASVNEEDQEDFFTEYIKNEEGAALDLEAEFLDGYVDEEMVREKLKRINYNEEQISEVIQGYEQEFERY